MAYDLKKSVIALAESDKKLKEKLIAEGVVFDEVKGLPDGAVQEAQAQSAVPLDQSDAAHVDSDIEDKGTGIVEGDAKSNVSAPHSDEALLPSEGQEDSPKLVIEEEGQTGELLSTDSPQSNGGLEDKEPESDLDLDADATGQEADAKDLGSEGKEAEVVKPVKKNKKK